MNADYSCGAAQRTSGRRVHKGQRSEQPHAGALAKLDSACAADPFLCETLA